jgi:hypothetical protein
MVQFHLIVEIQLKLKRRTEGVYLRLKMLIILIEEFMLIKVAEFIGKQKKHLL